MIDDFPAAHSMDSRWFAVDEVGHIAMFDTGENGPLPLSSVGLNLNEESEVSGLFGELWRIYYPDAPQPELDENWEERDKKLAEELGVFYFSYGIDFDPIGTYERWVAPRIPRHLDQLPQNLRDLWKSLCFDNVNFAHVSAIQPLEHEDDCEYWYEEDRLAYLCSDGKTVRPILGMEDRFADFCKQFREENPQEAKKLIFEGLEEEPKQKRSPRKRRKRGEKDT